MPLQPVQDLNDYIYVLTPQGDVENVSLTSRSPKRKEAERVATKEEIDGLIYEFSALINVKSNNS